MVRIYGIRNCDTMKKTFAWLDAHGVDYEFHDYKASGVPKAKLKDWAERVGWEKLPNTRGTTWRKLNVKDVNGARALALLEQNPSAIRRPVVEIGADLVIGFDPRALERCL